MQGYFMHPDNTSVQAQLNAPYKIKFAAFIIPGELDIFFVLPIPRRFQLIFVGLRFANPT